jgi:hypothetical protein
MKSLPKLTLAAIALFAIGYGVNSAILRGAQEDSPKGPVAEKRSLAPGKKPAGGSPRESSPDEPGPESPDAKAALEQARQRLKAYRSIKTKLQESVALGGRRFTVKGEYLQGADLKLRLDFHVKLGETDGSVLEVCDGQVLWTRHHVGAETRITRRDVSQIQQAAAGAGLTDNRLIVELGFGGLPGLFASIEKSMQFDKHKEEAFEGHNEVVVEGGWRPAMLKSWKGDNPKAPLPDYVPARIRLYLDAETSFPRRILYLSRNAEQALRPMVSLEFSDVQTDISIPAEAFKFVPPEGVFPADLTQEFLDQIKQRQLGGTPRDK